MEMQEGGSSQYPSLIRIVHPNATISYHLWKRVWTLRNSPARCIIFGVERLAFLMSFSFTPPPSLPHFPVLKMGEEQLLMEREADKLLHAAPSPPFLPAPVPQAQVFLEMGGL